MLASDNGLMSARKALPGGPDPASVQLVRKAVAGVEARLDAGSVAIEAGAAAVWGPPKLAEKGLIPPLPGGAEPSPPAPNMARVFGLRMDAKFAAVAEVATAE